MHKINEEAKKKEWRTIEIDPYDDTALAFTIDKLFEENQVIQLNDTQIQYNLIKYDYEKIRAGEEQNPMRSNRIHPISGYIIVFTDGQNTQYITDRSGAASTLTTLRKLNNYNKHKQILGNPFTITEDVFTWMIYKVLNHGNESLEEDIDLFIRQIIGFKSSTNDKLAEVKGTGNRILSQLGTLAYLFENEVTYILPRITYDSETIEFSIDLRGNIDINFETYVGLHIFDLPEERFTKITLITYLEVVPRILAKYHSETKTEVEDGNKEWCEEVKVNFFTDIGTSITDQIKEKLEASKKKS